MIDFLTYAVVLVSLGVLMFETFKFNIDNKARTYRGHHDLEEDN